MPFQAQPRRKTICKSLINPVDMLLTECGNIGAVESVDKAGVFPRVANRLSILVLQEISGTGCLDGNQLTGGQFFPVADDESASQVGDGPEEENEAQFCAYPVIPQPG